MQSLPHALVCSLRAQHTKVRTSCACSWSVIPSQDTTRGIRCYVNRHRIVRSSYHCIAIANAQRAASSSLLTVGDEDALVAALLRGDTVHRPEDSHPAPSETTTTTSSSSATLAIQNQSTGTAGRAIPTHTTVTPSFIPDVNAANVTESRVANALATPFMHTRRLPLRVGRHHTSSSAARFDPRGVEWMCCRCRTYNFVGRRSCRRCSADESESYKVNFPPTRHVPLLPHTWQCESCPHMNSAPSQAGVAQSRAKFLCSSCTAPFPGVREWYCIECDHINSPAATQCATCFIQRRPSWECGSCGESNNSIFLSQCRKCGEKRTALVSDSTTLCSVCNQRNDVQWELCFSCMTPLPLLQRTHDAQQVISQTARLSREAQPASHTSNESQEQLELFAADGDAEGEGEGERERDVENAVRAAPPHRGSTANLPNAELKRNDVPPVLESVDPDLVGLEPGSWKCYHCNVLQRRNASFCDICLQPRSISGKPPAATSAETTTTITTQDAHLAGAGATSTPTTVSPLSEHKGASTAPGSWTCPHCRSQHSAQTDICCGKRRVMAIGYWQCSECSSINRDERRNCLGCDALRPLRQWWCSDCNAQNAVNSFMCMRCGTSHPSKWKCPACETVADITDASCSACGVERPTKLERSAKKACPRCHTENALPRKVCYRCQARFGNCTWDCVKCGAKENKETALRCGECGTPKPHNGSESLWVCEVCEEPVRSRDDIPSLNYCPHCNSPKTASCVVVPAMWKCDCCEVYNEFSWDKCRECGHRRCLHGMKTNVTCPNCFAATELKEDERCGSCHGSLAVLVDNLGKQSFRTFSSGSATMDLPMKYSTTAPADIAQSIASQSSRSEAIQALTAPVKAKPISTPQTAQMRKSLSDANPSTHPTPDVNQQRPNYDNNISTTSGLSSSTQSRAVQSHNERIASVEHGFSAHSSHGSKPPSTRSNVNPAPRVSTAAFPVIDVEPTAEEDGALDAPNGNSEHLNLSHEYDESDGDDLEDDESLDVDRFVDIEIPSWTCPMCETENLSDDPRCVECGLVKADTIEEI